MKIRLFFDCQVSMLDIIYKINYDHFIDLQVQKG